MKNIADNVDFIELLRNYSQNMVKAKSILFLWIILAILLPTISNAQDLGNGLIGYWTFDNNSKDEITGKSLKIFGNPQLISGKYGNAFKLNGKSDYFLLEPSDTTMKYYPETGMTWSIWMKGDSLPNATAAGYGNILISAKDVINSEDIYLGFGSILVQKRKLVFEVDGVGGFGGMMQNPPEYYPTGGFSPSKWYCVTGVRDFDSDSIFLYVDGILVSSKRYKLEPILKDMYFAIGAFYDGVDSSNFFDGALDEVRIYNRPLSRDEVFALSNMDSILLNSDENPIDFGTIFCSDEKTHSFYLKNKSNFYQSLIKGTLIDGSNFTIVDIDTSLISPGDSVKITVKFKPNTTGIFNDTLILSNKGFLPPMQLALMGRKDIKSYELEGLSNDTINFDITCYNTQVDTSFTINIKSTAKTKLYGSISSPFTFIDNSLDSLAPAFDSLQKVKIGLRFPGFPIDTVLNGTIKLVDECGIEKIIYLVAEVNKPDFAIQNTIDTLLCPETEGNYFLKIKNQKKANLILNLVGDNPEFTYFSKHFIVPEKLYLLPIKYKGSKIPGLKTLNLKINAACGNEVNVKLQVNVTDIGIFLSADTVDFGTLTLCDTSSKIEKSIYLKNENIVRNVFVSNVKIDNPFFTDVKSGDGLEISKVKDIKITFKPNQEGLFTGYLNILLDTCNTMKKIFLIAKAERRDFNYTSSINFGKRLTGSVNDTSFFLKNTGTSKLIINNFVSAGDTFVISSSKSLPIQLISGDSILINVRFNSKLGLNNKTIYMLDSSDCGITKNGISVSGEGVDQAFLLLKVVDIPDAEVNGSLKLKIQLVKSTNLLQSAIKDLKATISVNPSIMIPFGLTPKGVLKNNRLEIPIDLSLSNATDLSILKELEFKTALGNADIDTISIKDVVASEGYWKDSTISGILIFKNICKAGGTRLFDFASNLNLSEISPNPASGIITIDFGLIEKGLTKIYIVNTNGEIERTIFQEVKEIGKYILYYDTKDLPQGNYYLVVETPNNLLSKKLSIVR